MNYKNALINENEIDIQKYFNDDYNVDRLDYSNIIDYYSDKKCVYIHESLYHDGCDRYGPKSNLYDLEIIYIKDGKKISDWWHRENWFESKTPEPYYKCSSGEVDLASFNAKMEKSKAYLKIYYKN